ncbi:MAG TPA: SDR family oxidoreductase [Lacipirellulaceae bacterium]|jgi:NAD(P)-dependent dehydrogenase (short-subunit alcohol dehydrogenase family)|nr:SDR family oxidoreductase [Lacipirellulaceae bacterium]
MARLTNKVAIVTGAAHGIGRAIAESFAHEGAWVLVADLDQDAGAALVAEIRAAGGRAEFVKTDVTSLSQVERAVEVANNQSQRIDVLVNNAAHLGDWLDVEQATSEQWDRSFGVTLKGAAHFTRAVLASMTLHKSGSIINIASMQALVAGRSSAVYTSLKHALIGLTRSTALDFGTQGIRANAICPGPIRTRISPPLGSEMHQRQISKTMLGRTGEPREVAATAVFLASDESSYITGAAIPVDGGWTAF